MCVAHNQDFAVGEDLNQKQKVQMCKLGDVLSKVVQLKHITAGSGGEAPAAGQFFGIFLKN